jgi:hypothetical protein
MSEWAVTRGYDSRTFLAKLRDVEILSIENFFSVSTVSTSEV